MIVKFKNPKLVKISEIIEAYKKGKYYIERFEYGDYDNLVDAIITNIEIYNSTFCPNTIYGPKYNVCICKNFKYSLEDENIYTAYPSYLEDKESDIFNKEIEVIGYATESISSIKLVEKENPTEILYLQYIGEDGFILCPKEDEKKIYNSNKILLKDIDLIIRRSDLEEYNIEIIRS